MTPSVDLLAAVSAASGAGRRVVFRRPDGSRVETTVGQLLARGARVAGGLRAAGVAAGQVVPIVGPAGLELIAAWLGALWAGAVPSLLAPPNQRQQADLWVAGLRHVVGYTGAPAVVVDAAYRDAIDRGLATAPGEPLPADLLDTATLLDGSPVAMPPPGDPDAIVLLQHSSGTTGLHKGVALTHRCLLTQVELYAEALALDPARDRIASWLPIYHDMGLIACLVLPLVTGTELVWMDNFEWARQPGMLLDAIDAHGSTLCWLPNFAFHHLTTAPLIGTWDLSSVRLWTNCSEPVKAHSLDRFVERFAAHGVTAAALGSSYALAENTFAATQSVPGQALRRRPLPGGGSGVIPSSGRLLVQHEVEIRASDGAVLADGEIGQIWLRSPCLMAGYHRRDEPVLQAGWYGTGDLGLLDDGELFVCGRARDLAIVAGKNVFPEDVESILSQLAGLHPGRNVAFGVDDEGLGTQRLVAVGEHPPGAAPDRKQARALQRAARERVAEQIGVRLDELRIVAPRTLLKSSSGKLSRPRCRELYLGWVAEESRAGAGARATQKRS